MSASGLLARENSASPSTLGRYPLRERNGERNAAYTITDGSAVEWSAMSESQLTLQDVDDVLANWRGWTVAVRIKQHPDDPVPLGHLMGQLSERRDWSPDVGLSAYAVGDNGSGDFAFLIDEPSFQGAEIGEGDALVMRFLGGYIEVAAVEHPDDIGGF